jgi:foldase protein PrsA
MIARDRGRKTFGWMLGFALTGMLATVPALAQQRGRLFGGGKAAAAPKAEDSPAADSPAADAPQRVRLDQINVPGVKMTAVPVNPTDPIAIVNDQIISRQQLSDECVARKGKEILETLINRTLIEQALKSRKQEVTPAEIDQEINNVAARFGIGREAWLRTLDKERGISPLQYGRDIIYPALALRKLCAGRVTVTPKDLQDAFDSQYGDKLRCRMIMVDKLAKAQDVWERLHKNPGGFEKIAQEESMDAGSRSLGGQLAEPITRHAYPQNVSDAAFRQLVDGDPEDKDPTHKPKNGDVSGPIQAAESVWVVLRRDAVIPAVEGVSLKDERIKKQVYEMIYEVKLKETMGAVFQELVKAAAIENKLVGSVKLANEEQSDDYNSLDKNSVKLMSNAGGAAAPKVDPSVSRTGGAAGGGTRAKLPPPVAASPEAIQQFENLQKRPLKVNGGNAADAPATTPLP